MKRVYKKRNTYIQDYHDLDGVIYLLKNDKCYRWDKLLKRIHQNISQSSIQAVWRKQYISEYREIRYIYSLYWQEIPSEYYLCLDYETDI